MPVKIVGWIHGVLFIAYIIQLMLAKEEQQWAMKKVIIGAVAAFFPFGTLWFDKQLKGASE
jgi:integral membrane protein